MDCNHSVLWECTGAFSWEAELSQPSLGCSKLGAWEKKGTAPLHGGEAEWANSFVLGGELVLCLPWAPRRALSLLVVTEVLWLCVNSLFVSAAPCRGPPILAG